MIEFLLEREKQFSWGKGNLALVKYLIEIAKADLTIKDGKEESALEWAKGHEDIINFLIFLQTSNKPLAEDAMAKSSKSLQSIVSGN
ncbi:TPA: hypothetical protein DDZ86_03690 [Candidatus Dependentiae bacterium]|nr:MAG: hypothetical protein UW09_C0003G0091 [candidate division TM6 bacterium GW2011_GWF2_43_87]HBL98718.1 hypothetical protein [Candidatus Dependentiae bacterium]